MTSTTEPAIRTHLPAAVLWDMDGTLIDSEPYWIAEEHALVESFGGTWTDAHAHALVGDPLEVSAQYIIDHSPVEADVDEVVDTLCTASWTGSATRCRGVRGRSSCSPPCTTPGSRTRW